MKTPPSIFLTLLSAIVSAQAPKLPLPVRNSNAPLGSAFAKSIEQLPLQKREEQIFKQVQQGNIPDFERQLVSVDVTDGTTRGQIFALPDYLAIGDNEDYFFVPMTPYTAQKIADLTHCILPTPKMVDDIYSAAPLKLTPNPITPTSYMTLVPFFENHNQIVKEQRKAAESGFPLGTLTAGDKKDIVICAGLTIHTNNVAIYGWHKAVGSPIQPLYLKHVSSWADYSHGVRLVSETMEIDGKPAKVQDVLADPAIAGLLSGEGVITQPKYVFKEFPKDWSAWITVPKGEKLERLFPAPGVRVLIDEPAELKHKITLVLYALPNGNTIEQTFGKKLQPGMDWHFDIQNIGAQTRFLRQQLNAIPKTAIHYLQDSTLGAEDSPFPAAFDFRLSTFDSESQSKIENRKSKIPSLVMAYLENDKHSWPTFLGQAPSLPVDLVNNLVDHFKGYDISVVLDSHSGGGSFIFHYINDVAQIPDNIERIAFLDSEYNYETDLHLAKLTNWLQNKNHYLCAIAYDDASALLNGKSFVTAQGGTWGRTHLMLQDLGKAFDIKQTNTTDPARLATTDGSIVFWLKENPNHEIFHTVQVEKNGFIESILSGTPLEGKDYVYFGDRAYSGYIRE